MLVLSSPKKLLLLLILLLSVTATTKDKKVNANSEYCNKNRRPGPVNTYSGGNVGICKPASGLTRAGKYKFGARVSKYKLGDWDVKYKLGASAGKYKLGARVSTAGEAEGRGPGNTNTQITTHHIMFWRKN